MTAQRLHLAVRGAVQGVGFRPFVYRLATEMGLPGWVVNAPQGLFVEVEGEQPRLDMFVRRLETEKPSRSSIQELECSFLDPVGFTHFEIRRSDGAGEITTLVPPDLATCADCRQEIFDPTNRRYRYPFTNCTNCGPRFTILTALPYDRVNTTMKRFTMCDACRREYDDPLDRRFHAQPNACPDCGPHLELWDETGANLVSHDLVVLEAARAIREGKIVAVKGLGGFHLMADGGNERAVVRLRERKRRPEKPFALLFPSLEAVKAVCKVSPLEARLLCSSEAPIVLLHQKALYSKIDIRKSKISVAPSVAPRNPYLGIMLPYTPLHHLLLAELNAPVVATSGNRADEPICTDAREAVERLRGIADVWLVHNRPIVRPVDDSVVRVMMGRELVLRRARGYAPLPIRLAEPAPPMLAVGGHLKNTVAVTAGRSVVISQHIGDLETLEADRAFRSVIDSVYALYPRPPGQVVCDLHPDYRSTHYAKQSGLPLQSIQHHHAHVASCMAEHGLVGPLLGVAWDGSGYGPDGTIWGGEFFLADETSGHRIATFRTFRLPGGGGAINEPRRSAIGLLHELWGDALFEREELDRLRSLTAIERSAFRQMLGRELYSPRTSSVGRLFDAVAALIGLRDRVSFEGQAAMALECAAEGVRTDATYPFRISDGVVGAMHELPLQIIDWEPMVLAILDDTRNGVAIGTIAATFHNTLAEIIVAIAGRAGQERVVLSGGCFQNRYLTERVVPRLRAAGFHPHWHRRVPPNDGGLSLGQIYIAVHRAKPARAVAPPEEV